MTSIYLAAPLFTQAEREFNIRLAERLEKEIHGLTVWLPQRDGKIFVDLLDTYLPDEAAVLTRDADLAAIDRSSYVLAVLDGAGVDEGVALELGYALARGVHRIGLRTDVRLPFACGVNPMVRAAVEWFFSDVEDVLRWLALGDRPTTGAKP